MVPPPIVALLFELPFDLFDLLDAFKLPPAVAGLPGAGVCAALPGILLCMPLGLAMPVFGFYNVSRRPLSLVISALILSI